MSSADDDGLREALRRADPAAELPALGEQRLHRLIGDTMDTTTRTADARPRPRRMIAIGVVAAAAAAALIVTIGLNLGTGGRTQQLAQPAGGGPAAICAEITPEALASSQQAFGARVTSIADGTVTLSVQRRFAGDVPDTITTTQGTDSGVDGEPITFVDGGEYLVTASDGVIRTCGQSGPASPELTELYEAAFD